MKRIFKIGAALAFAAIAGSAHAQGFPPGTTARSPGSADDQTSWAVFISAITPVPASAGWPAGTLTYETWATDNDTFGSSGPHWPSPTSPPTARFQASALGLHVPTGLKALLAPADSSGAGIPASVQCNPVGNAAAGAFPTPASSSPPANCAAEEVRRNQATFNYIASTPLYTQSQLATFAQSSQTVSFPSSGQKGSLTNAAIEVKVDWVPVGTVVTWLNSVGVQKVDTAYVMANYFTTQQGSTTYAMLSMHVNLKDRPDWLWGTFEHQMNPGRCDTMGCYDEFGMTGKLRSIPPNGTKSNGIYPVCTGKSAALVQMLTAAGIGSGSVWNNYCLKSTQTEFTVPGGTRPPSAKAEMGAGAPVALLSGDSVVERIVANVPIAKSSCITCHSYAAFTKDGTIRGNLSASTITPPLPPACNPGLISGSGPIGKQDPGLISGQKQYDFVWGMINIAPIDKCSP